MDNNFILDQLIQQGDVEPVLNFFENLNQDSWKKLTTLQIEKSLELFTHTENHLREKIYLIIPLIFLNEKEQLNCLEYFIKQGKFKIVYEKIFEFKSIIVKRNKPKLTNNLNNLQNLYFHDDVNLKLIDLMIMLSQGKIKEAEADIKRLQKELIQNFKLKNKYTIEKNLYEIIQASTNKYNLSIYEDFYGMRTGQMIEKRNKKLAEFLIYFDDIDHLLMLIPEIRKVLNSDQFSHYVKHIKKHLLFSRIYVSKYFLTEVEYFKSEQTEKVNSARYVSSFSMKDLKVEVDLLSSEVRQKINVAPQVFNYSHYELKELKDFLQLAVLENDWGKVNTLLELVKEKEIDGFDIINYYYLKYHVYESFHDYRQAIDVCFKGLELSEKRDDILCFLYFIAQSYIELKDNKNAKIYLKKIIKIDENYRLARKKYEEINEL